MGERVFLHSDWALCPTPPGAYPDPVRLRQTVQPWSAASVPGTAASSLRAADSWSLHSPPVQFDDCDWWYRLTFASTAFPAGVKRYLGFDGLATLAEVWLNDLLILRSENMFVQHELEITDCLRDQNELLICCRSLNVYLRQRRPRPRWRSPMVGNQQLRWSRTTLLGRTPGWSPPAAPVGPWRPIWLDDRVDGTQYTHQVHTTMAGEDGLCKASLNIHPTPDRTLRAHLLVIGGGQTHRQDFSPVESHRWEATLRISNVCRWWPHTHGNAERYDVCIVVDSVRGASHTLRAGSVGFRQLRLDHADGEFSLVVNDEAVFWRGACWTPLDVVSLNSPPSAYREAISAARDCGMNMLRVTGPTIYEADEFYDECDRQGIMVWQDFMFANMDYPADDASFSRTACLEVEQFLRRVGHRPCLALLCGNSEVEQQAAMSAADRTHWQPPLFHQSLRQVAHTVCPDLPYWPSSAHGGAFPHDGASGTTGYFGVGAYLRPLSDARHSAPRFATECLALANVPDDAGIHRLSPGHALRVHHPLWKQRAPRDLGAGWDFDDVRDYYLRELTGLDPLMIRYSDHERYVALSRMVSADVMTSAMGEWRRSGSRCTGALILSLRDLWDGAGWGIIAADGTAKAPFYRLRPLLQPQAMWITGEGTNGLHLHIANDTAAELRGELTVTLYRKCERAIATASAPIAVAGRLTDCLPLASLFDEWHDLDNAYRFGPQQFDLLCAHLTDGVKTVLETNYSPSGLLRLGLTEPGMRIEASAAAEGGVLLLIESLRFAHAVTIDAAGYRAADQFFDVAPGTRKLVALTPNGARPAAHCQVAALNAASSHSVVLPT